MEAKDIIKKYKRDYNIEKKILCDFSEVLKNYISFKNIQNTLYQNGFNGIYLLEKKAFSRFRNSNKIMGLYDEIEKVIIMNKDEYLYDERIAIHEMGHAFLDCKSQRKIEIDGKNIKYGVGLEEGAVTLLMCTSNVNDISEINKYAYLQQSRLFQQLNALYNYSNVKEYDNLLIHLLLKPDKFIPLVRDIYEDIFKTNYPDFNCSLSTKSAHSIICGTDTLIDYQNDNLYGLLKYINALYLNVADSDVRNGKETSLFIKSKDFNMTREEILLSQIFNKDYSYVQRQQSNLDVAIRLVNEELEECDIKDDDKLMIKKY